MVARERAALVLRVGTLQWRAHGQSIAEELRTASLFADVTLGLGQLSREGCSASTLVKKLHFELPRLGLGHL